MGVRDARHSDPAVAAERHGGERYVYCWGNNPRRAELKGRECVVVARGRMRTVLVEFTDTGERVTTSARAIRPVVEMAQLKIG